MERLRMEPLRMTFGPTQKTQNGKTQTETLLDSTGKTQNTVWPLTLVCIAENVTKSPICRGVIS
jgi:hypothetical protein